jgi:hypothetical protein
MSGDDFVAAAFQSTEPLKFDAGAATQRQQFAVLLQSEEWGCVSTTP